MINDIDKGGMNMIDFKSFCTAAKAVWVQRLYYSKEDTWSYIPKTFFETCELNVVMCMNFEKEKHLPIKLPQLYKEAILSWHLCGGGSKAPQDISNIRQQLIWGNKFIQTKGRTLFFENWKNSNINFIDDLLNENGTFKAGEEIFDQLISKRNWIVEYITILKAIPSSWKNKISGTNMNTKHAIVKKSFNPFLEINNKVNYKLPAKSKDYCNILIHKCKKEHTTKNIDKSL